MRVYSLEEMAPDALGNQATWNHIVPAIKKQKKNIHPKIKKHFASEFHGGHFKDHMWVPQLTCVVHQRKVYSSMVTNSKLQEINVSSSVWEGIMIQVPRKVTKSLIDMVWNFPKSYCLTRQREDMSKILCHFRYDAAFPENFVTPIVMQLNLDAVQFLNWIGYLQYPVYFHRKWNEILGILLWNIWCGKWKWFQGRMISLHNFLSEVKAFAAIFVESKFRKPFSAVLQVAEERLLAENILQHQIVETEILGKWSLQSSVFFST